MNVDEIRILRDIRSGGRLLFAAGQVITTADHDIDCIEPPVGFGGFNGFSVGHVTGAGSVLLERGSEAELMGGEE